MSRAVSGPRAAWIQQHDQRSLSELLVLASELSGSQEERQLTSKLVFYSPNGPVEPQPPAPAWGSSLGTAKPGIVPILPHTPGLGRSEVTSGLHWGFPEANGKGPYLARFEILEMK